MTSRLFLQAFQAILVLFVVTLAAPSFAQQGDPKPLIDQIGKADFAQAETLIGQIAATGDARVVPALQAFSDGDLYVRKSDSLVFIGKGSGANLDLTEPVTGASAGSAPKGAMTKLRINNNLRRAIRSAMGGLTLMSPDRGTRLAAADSVLRAPSAENLELLETAIAKETDGEVKTRMEEARAVSILSSDRPVEAKRAAITTIKGLGGREALGILSGAVATADPALKGELEASIKSINDTLALWDMVQNVWFGLSLGSVLLLAGIGLAITFGVMGIINMAHGEMVMLGAYCTYMVQHLIRTEAPWLFNWSLAIALPVAFLVTGAVGFVIERGIIRFLYGRPLETLLATWGVSLILQQAIRTIFGPTNQEVGNPSWMSGSFALGGLNITWNRLWILVFAVVIFFSLMALMKKSAYGLNMRAVTQNRRMASSMGIRTPWVDALTFALGSGIAGIAGVALSQIDNVSPNLGQSYIIDSFMVVVFGGVGNLWGTLVGALSLGVLNKFLEPSVGAVLGKILVLVLIILFIQKRPRGLFALKGRAVEA
ncbi:MAG: urea ABC transporter permease subunit UrtB [Neorhizobium sp.]|nr:urea ABC transporter permease subunit UrtB [Neorhizobium sp.]